MATPMAVSASTWNSIKPSNLALSPDLFTSILVERQALSCQGSGFAPSVVSHINTSLSTSATRLEGLFLLQHFIEQCASDSLNDAALSWIGQLTNILQSYETTVVHQVSCEILAALFAEIRPLTELSHEASTSHLPQVVLALLGAKEQWHLSAIRCLLSCMENFPGPCGPFKDKIEKFILPSILDGAEPEAWKTCSRCYALLPTCGGGGHQSIKHSEAWESHCSLLLGSLQVTLTELYQGLEDEDDLPSPRHTLKGLEPIDEMDSNRYHKLTNRFLAVGTCLTAMLRNDYGFSLKIPAKEVLNFVCRCLAVNSKFLESRPSTERLLLATVVSQIHQGALNIVESLIHSCRTILLPQSNIMNKLLLQTLSWTQTDENVVRGKAYSGLRGRAYSTLIMWLKACGTLQSMDSLVQSVMMDVKPCGETLKLNSHQSKLSDAQELMSSKKKKRKQKSQMSTVGAVSKIPQKGSPEMCSNALKALRQILLSTGHCLKTRTLQNVEEFIIPLLLKIQNGDATAPYGNGSCRMDLYRTLHAMVLVSHPTWQPSVHCIIGLFSTGQRDANIEVSSYAMESLALCTALIHPKVPTLYRAPPVVKKDKNNVTFAETSMDSTNYSQLNKSLFMTNGNNTGFQTGGGDAKLLVTSVVDLDYNIAGSNHGGARVEQDGTRTEQGAQADAVTEVEIVTIEDSDSVGDEEADATADESGDRVAVVTRKLAGGENVSGSYITCDKENKERQALEQTVSKKRKLEPDDTAESEPSEKVCCPSPKSSSSGNKGDSPSPKSSSSGNKGDSPSPKSSSSGNKEDSPSGVVDSMLMSFVDAGPDSE